MKSETRLKKMAELLGLDNHEVVKELLPQPDPDAEIRVSRAIAARAAESFLAYMRSYELFDIKKCTKCGKPFAHTYGRVSTCSDLCLKRSLEDMGFTWDPTKPPEERWRPSKWFEWRARPFLDSKNRPLESPEEYQDRRRHIESNYPVPLIVPPEALEALHNLLQEVFQNQSLPE